MTSREQDQWERYTAQLSAGQRELQSLIARLEEAYPPQPDPPLPLARVSNRPAPSTMAVLSILMEVIKVQSEINANINALITFLDSRVKE